jgi:hypothetical protein
MTQSRATSPQVIYNKLTSDSTFMALVGDRVFNTGGTTLDAISIVTPGEKLPDLQSVSGLEVAIHDIANLGRRPYLTGDDDITVDWKVYLMAWPPANGSTLYSAALRIMSSFSKAVTIETAPTPEGLGVIAQVLVLIPSDSVVA